MFYILLSTILLLLSSQPVLAEDGYVNSFQGAISATDGIPKYIVVNEHKLLLDEKVIVKNHKEKDASLSDLKAGQWIYIAAQKRPAGLTALRIYLLPRHVPDKEKSGYPFMEKEEEPED